MDNISNLKATICALIGAMGGLIVKLFGGWSEDMATLIIFMAVDFIMGLLIAGVFNNSTKSKTGALSSHAGWKGLCKKGMAILFVLIAHRLDLLLNTDYIRTSTIIGFISIEALSIIENAMLMGLPLPKVITKAIESLKSKEGEDE